MSYDEICEQSEGVGGTLQASMPKPVTLNERIKREQEELRERMADLKRASDILAKNPEIEELLNILHRSGRRLL